MHNRGQLGEQIMVFMFIFLMFVIGAGIVLGTYFFIGPEFDFRAVEADMLSYKIKDCILNDGSLFDGIKANPDLFYTKCSLNKEVIESNNAIRVCPGAAEVNICLDPNNPDAVFAVGNYGLCDPAGSNKIVGCSVASFSDSKGTNYVIIATSKQKIRRNAK